MREAAAAAASALEAADAAEGASDQKQAAAPQPLVTTSLQASDSGRLAFAIEPKGSPAAGPPVKFAAGDRSVAL